MFQITSSKLTFLRVITFIKCGPGSSVGIVTELRAGRSGIESRWGRDFPPLQTGPAAHPASCKMGTGSLPGVKCGRGLLLTTHPLLMPRSWKSRAIPTLGHTGPVTGTLYLLYFFITLIMQSHTVTKIELSCIQYSLNPS